MNLIVISLITLAVTGCLAAIILYVAAQKFKVVEDPRIDQVNDALPGANCGGCGFPGCRGFAEACVKADTLEGLSCPVGGSPTMSQVAGILGLAATESDPMVAVLRCNGTHARRGRRNTYDGSKSCKIAHSLYGGETGCVYGCIGFGDCEVSCKFDALHMDAETGLPVIDEEKCVACNACVKACPKVLIELRKKGPKSRRIYVSCMSKDKGGVARKVCASACIGCGKCVKVCPFDAITLENNLAYIDYTKCRLCRKCVAECPTAAITELNFPPRPPKAEPAAVAPKVVKVSEPVAEVKEVPVETPAAIITEVISEPAEKVVVVEQPKEVTVEEPVAEKASDDSKKPQEPEARVQSLDL